MHFKVFVLSEFDYKKKHVSAQSCTKCTWHLKMDKFIFFSLKDNKEYKTVSYSNSHLGHKIVHHNRIQIIAPAFSLIKTCRNF